MEHPCHKSCALNNLFNIICPDGPGWMFYPNKEVPALNPDLDRIAQTISGDGMTMPNMI